VYVHKTIACTDRYARRWIETVGGSGDCMPRGSASRSDTIVIGKPISSTRNIPARYPGSSEPGGSLIPISARLRPFCETPRLLSIGLTVSPSELKNMFTVFPVSLPSPSPHFYPPFLSFPPRLPFALHRTPWKRRKSVLDVISRISLPRARILLSVTHVKTRKSRKPFSVVCRKEDSGRLNLLNSGKTGLTCRWIRNFLSCRRTLLARWLISLISISQTDMRFQANFMLFIARRAMSFMR
jgi:hypothetical protein